MRRLIAQFRKQMAENCKLAAITRLHRDFGSQVAVKLKELGYGG